MSDLGTGQNWRRGKGTTLQRNVVFASWNHECAVTGEKNDLVMHHFFSGSRFTKNPTVHENGTTQRVV